MRPNGPALAGRACGGPGSPSSGLPSPFAPRPAVGGSAGAGTSPVATLCNAAAQPRVADAVNRAACYCPRTPATAAPFA